MPIKKEASLSTLFSHSQPNVGFTLIELSIVLVIIGLIIGGILTGQDLIRSAEIRATLAQIEKYNTATNTFRNKYNALPGDILYSQASSFKLSPVISSPCCVDPTYGTPIAAGGMGFGDGNGVIVDFLGGSGAVGEPIAFWAHLSATGLIDGSYGLDIGTGGLPTGTTPDSDIPKAKIGRGNYIMVGSTPGNINYFSINGISLWAPTNAGGGTTTAGISNNLTPTEAYNMDKKIDDGLPFNGTVIAPKALSNEIEFQFQTTGANWSATATSGNCTYSGANNKDTTQQYNISSSTGGNVQACTVAIRAAF